MRFKRITTAMIARKEALQEYRKRNLVFWALFLGWLPAISMIAIPLGRQLNSDGVAQAVVAVWFVTLVAAAIWRLRYQCPRCGKSFYHRWWYNNAFAMKCVNCGYKPGQAS